MGNHNLLAFLIWYSRKETGRKNKSLQTLEEYCNKDVKANELCSASYSPVVQSLWRCWWWKEKNEHAQTLKCHSLRPRGLQPTRLL